MIETTREREGYAGSALPSVEIAVRMVGVCGSTDRLPSLFRLEVEMQIEIRVVGQPKTGKSTIAYYIAKALIELGFRVDMVDDSSPSEREDIVGSADMRLATLKEKHEVMVETIQVGRNGKEYKTPHRLSWNLLTGAGK